MEKLVISPTKWDTLLLTPSFTSQFVRLSLSGLSRLRAAAPLTVSLSAALASFSLLSSQSVIRASHSVTSALRRLASFSFLNLYTLKSQRLPGSTRNSGDGDGDGDDEATKVHSLEVQAGQKNPKKPLSASSSKQTERPPLTPTEHLHSDTRSVTVLNEMKTGLDTVSLTAKVKADHSPTADGLSYLETKHLLLLNYCQSLVYYLLRKAKGLSIEGHQVVRSLVEMRLFLEKIRSIDKKMQYQIQKLTRDSDIASEKSAISEKGTDTQKEDLLKYRPNPDMLVPKTSNTTEDGANVYRPPKFAPASMGEEKM